LKENLSVVNLGAPFTGSVKTTSGGTKSLGPPVGGVIELAQLTTNIVMIASDKSCRNLITIINYYYSTKVIEYL
jgi:hypothetical protein